MMTRLCTAGLSIPAAVFGVWFAGAGCASLPRQVAPRLRQADYLAQQPELSPDIVRAMQAGRILLGMDTKQVWVVLGDPARKTRFADADTDVWLYRAYSVLQDHYRLGTQDVRLIFVQDRLVVIEPM